LYVDAQDWDIPKLSNAGWEIDQSFALNNKRKNILLISEASIYTLSLVGLNQLWYADYPISSFHFINDNGEWLQMDKIGHLAVSYYTGVAGIKAYKWAGFSRKKSIWYGGITGSIFLTVVEILDGRSMQWGASAGDLIANTTGSLLAIGQALRWNEQRIQLKYSYSSTNWASMNPSQLGKNSLERVLKDYNGQTYWLTLNIKSLFNITNDNFPNWLSLALGYGGDSMINPYPEDNTSVYRQYYLSFDVDLNRIKTKSRIVNSILHTFGFLKFPTPALEFSNGRFSFYPIYY
jgi:uncharacterized protein YfiM (DUF2279 family)